MEIKIWQGSIGEVAADLAVVNIFEGVKTPGGATGYFDHVLGGLITRLIEEGEIKGKIHETTLLHTREKIAPKRVLIVGLGKQKDFTLDRVRSVMAVAVKVAKSIGAKSVATIVHGAGSGGLDVRLASQALTEGAILGDYQFDHYFTHKETSPLLETLTIVENRAENIEQIMSGAKIGKCLAEATNFTRDLVNQPSNKMTPSFLSEKAIEVAKSYGLGYEVLEEKQMEKLGMGALLGVARGSAEPAKLIVLKYSSNEKTETILALVGKGITFDSGGVSLKPSEGLQEMKDDMAGGAAVIGAMQAIAQLKPAINVIGIVPATENMPDGKALKPGDIVKAMSGKTIEIISTDAEGRLILADAITYARKLGAKHIIDIATLTGACVIALGNITTGVLGNDQTLVDKVLKAAEQAGEKMWQLPLFEEYKELIKSDFADLKNSGGRPGGAITAAIFISEFAEDSSWVHLDIAGTSTSTKAYGYTPKGATGVGVRTLVNLALSLK